MPLSKNKHKYIQSLRDKKHRTEHSTFVAEGDKLVSDLLDSMHCQLLVATPAFLELIECKKNIRVDEIVEVDKAEIEKTALVKNPQNVIAVFYQHKGSPSFSDIETRLSLALDGVQDPGNLGTIVRIADWYGIENIFCSKDTADIYNPKTVQATMGALARVRVHYVDLVEFLHSQQSQPIYGTFLDGADIYTQNITSNGIIVMGNEGNGISKDIERCIKTKLYLPSYPKDRATSESLNVSVATAVVCAEFRRR
ncbi:TrmH family RNA methyltransferase [Dysgonomonas sp. PH5-45]|uniref:RNA methyltransferase n=1 Tax=unclassified Dysgonomonas TaxID=2630389 RepID=UPI0024765EED|nr:MULTISPECIES: RNA methyltransferase [unclassified Dysgonomonas]MDH6355795.1 TrmH family RNA methyltransferase [Dysgonomonas sp. PH5-45]MDH6388693.1 TrmH family RNA methyltransferase [Dysgonomonas sp. PH5-37]